MDPTACLRELLDALADEDRDTAVERAEDLRNWLNGGGFLPCVQMIEAPNGMTKDRRFVVRD